MRISLQRLIHGGKAPRADLNIEVGHISWSGPAPLERFQSELQKSTDLLAELSLDRLQFRITRCVLIDDHRLGDVARIAWFVDTIGDSAEVLQGIDYIVFESDLKQLLRVFYSKIKPRTARLVENEIERYIASKRRTACSHDIALWHSMRLGLLGVQGLPVYRIVADGHQASRALTPSFCASRIASILNINVREHEEDADTDFLRHVEALDGLQIQRYYYY